MNILICETDNFVRQTIAGYLSSVDPRYNLDEVGNGLECLDFVSDAVPDLILIALKMPVMDGYTTINKLKERKLKIPIIILGGFGGINNLVPDGYKCVYKPYKLSEISDLIKQQLNQTSDIALG